MLKILVHGIDWSNGWNGADPWDEMEGACVDLRTQKKSREGSLGFGGAEELHYQLLAFQFVPRFG